MHTFLFQYQLHYIPLVQCFPSFNTNWTKYIFYEILCTLVVLQSELCRCTFGWHFPNEDMQLCRSIFLGIASECSVNTAKGRRGPQWFIANGHNHFILKPPQHLQTWNSLVESFQAVNPIHIYEVVLPCFQIYLICAPI